MQQQKFQKFQKSKLSHLEISFFGRGVGLEEVQLGMAYAQICNRKRRKMVKKSAKLSAQRCSDCFAGAEQSFKSCLTVVSSRLMLVNSC